MPLSGLTATRLRNLLIIGNIALLITIVLIGTLTMSGPAALMTEGDLFTWISAAQLSFTAALALLIFYHSHQIISSWSLKHPHTVWLWIALGFTYLVGDQLLQFHEETQYWVKDMIDFNAAKWYTLTDEILILTYGLIGITVLYIYRAAFNDSPFVKRELAVGFCFLLLAILFDSTASFRKVVILLDDIKYYPFYALRHELWVIELLCEQLAQCFFISSFYHYYCTQKNTTKTIPVELSDD